MVNNLIPQIKIKNKYLKIFMAGSNWVFGSSKEGDVTVEILEEKVVYCDFQI